MRGLRRRILLGTLRPGETLNQNELVKEFGLNRSQVREGLTVLAEERLVRMRAYATASVAPLSLDEFQELHEVRVALEPMLSRQALPLVNRHHLLHMKDLVRVMAETEDGPAWLESNDELHASLYRLVNRPWLVEIVDRARRLSSRYTRVLIFEMDNRQPDHEHREIVEAIEAQDGKELERRLISHIKGGHDLVLEHLLAHPQLLESIDNDGA